MGDYLLEVEEISRFPWDIDGNGLVSPTDAIFAINRLGLSRGDEGFSPFADLDGSGLITPSDAIAFINRLGLLRDDI